MYDVELKVSLVTVLFLPLKMLKSQVLGLLTYYFWYFMSISIKLFFHYVYVFRLNNALLLQDHDIRMFYNCVLFVFLSYLHVNI